MDDVIAALDEFEKETGGENYDRTVVRRGGRQKDSSHNDELDQFMDEFEMNTAGEDFQHPSKREGEE